MTQIEPAALKEVRQVRNLSLEALSDLARIDKQTIHRLEKGRTGQIRQRTLAALAAALRVKPEVLTGEAPLPARKDSRVDLESEMQIRISDDARNALTLAAQRYRVDVRRIVEAAPFLFACAAESSLRQRQERLNDLEARAAQLEAFGQEFRHLSPLLTYNVKAQDIVQAERESIAANDLFGVSILSRDAEISNIDANEGKDNPIALFLTETAGQSLGTVQFHYWERGDAPQYTICVREALDLVGGDAEAAGAIVGGSAALHKMPPDVRAGTPKAKAHWALAENAAFIDEMDVLDSARMTSPLTEEDRG